MRFELSRPVASNRIFTLCFEIDALKCMPRLQKTHRFTHSVAKNIMFRTKNDSHAIRQEHYQASENSLRFAETISSWSLQFSVFNRIEWIWERRGRQIRFVEEDTIQFVESDTVQFVEDEQCSSSAPFKSASEAVTIARELFSSLSPR